jgi:CheY-like chemotaxis protein
VVADRAAEVSIIVLIVEDEALLRMNAAEIIRDAGFEVIETTNADEAISVLEARSDVYIVFTDIQMPGSMDGVKLAHAIRNRWPPIALVITSGHVRPKPEELPHAAHFLAKPYHPDELATVLHRLAA